jgi:hypothetical protein
MAHYALDNLPNKVLAAEYQMVLPDERLIAGELKRSGIRLEEGRMRRIQSDEPDSQRVRAALFPNQGCKHDSYRDVDLVT